MSKNGDTNQFQVYEICRDLYKNEQFFLNHQKNEEYNGFLIEKKSIEKINFVFLNAYNLVLNIYLINEQKWRSLYISISSL